MLSLRGLRGSYDLRTGLKRIKGVLRASLQVLQRRPTDPGCEKIRDMQGSVDENERFRSWDKRRQGC